MSDLIECCGCVVAVWLLVLWVVLLVFDPFTGMVVGVFTVIVITLIVVRLGDKNARKKRGPKS